MNDWQGPMSAGLHHSNAQADSVVEEIPREECLRLLATRPIGRVAVAEPGSPPLVVPVNFLLDGEAVVFRSDYGTKFRLMALAEQAVSFEVDDVDVGRPSGWSVLVQGQAYEATPWETTHLRLRPWAPGEKGHWVRIVPDSITGRRVRLSERPAFDERGYL